MLTNYMLCDIFYFPSDRVTEALKNSGRNNKYDKPAFEAVKSSCKSKQA